MECVQTFNIDKIRARKRPGCTNAELQLGRHMTRNRLDTLRVAVLAQDVVVQRVAPVPLHLRRQQHAAVLALVTQDVEAAIQRHHPNRLVLPRLRHYRPFAHVAARRELPEMKQLRNHAIGKRRAQNRYL